MKIGNVEVQLYRKNGYNSPATNERTVEIPLGFYFLENYSDALELGAVMPYYGAEKHEVWDLHDPHKCCGRVDLEGDDFDVSGRAVFSISTIEHVGFNNYGGAGFLPREQWRRAFVLLQTIVQNASVYLLTYPLGYNIDLDALVEAQCPNRIILRRINSRNTWEVDPTRSTAYCYGTPQSRTLLANIGEEIIRGRAPARFNNANGLCLITNIEAFHEG